MDLLMRIIIYGLTMSIYVMAECYLPDNDNDRYCHKTPQLFEIGCVSTVTYMPDMTTCVNYNTGKVEDHNHKIVINLINPDENPFPEDKTFFSELTIEHGYLVTIPEDIYNMTQLTDLKISTNKLRKINFNNFLSVQSLKKIDLSNNTIMVIETTEESIGFSTVQSIDVSFNFIEAVPNDFIKRFTELEHLNMSHNLISSIDKHAFEGTVQLKTLDLSHNKIQEVGNIFAQLPKLIETSSASSKNLQKLSKLVLDHNLITKINFTAFFDTGIPELSIGGNQIACSELATVKYSKFSEKFERIVTANVLVSYSENVNGISCEEVADYTADVLNVSDTTNANSSILVSLLKTAIENNSKSVDTLVDITNNNEKKLEQFMESTNLMLSSIKNQLAEIKNNLPNKPELFTGN